MTTITYPNSKFVFTDENGNTGTTILPESITTPSITVSSFVDSTGSTGATGYVLSSTGDGIAWVPSSGGTLLTGNLNMNNYSINNTDSINCTNLNVTNVNSVTTFANQISFSTPPTCSIGPTSANHLVIKDYVDTKSTPGIYHLFLNWSQSITIGNTGYTLLSPTMSTYTRPSVLSLGVAGNTTTVTPLVSFLSGNLNANYIPSSIFNLNIFSVNTVANTIVVYFFILKLYSNGVFTTLGTSSTSSTILNNTTGYPVLYTMSLTVPFKTILPSDAILLELHATNKSATSATLGNYFENKWYSYLEIESNTGIPFRISNWHDTATNDINMNGYDITSYRALIVSSPNKILNLGNQASSVNIEDTGVNSFVIIGSTGAGLPGGTGGIFLGRPLTLVNKTTDTTALGAVILATSSFTTFVNFALSTTATVTQSFVLPVGVWIGYAVAGLNITSSGTINRVTLTVYKDNARLINNYVCSVSVTNPVSVTALGYTYYLHCSGIIATTVSSTILIDHVIVRTGTVVQSGWDVQFRFVRIG